jgi:membrane protease YdiL (CAAX protease family)
MAVQKRTDGQSDPAQSPVVAGDYWSQSRRPLASLFFAAPLLAVYELGLIGLGPPAPRNGADDWMRKTLILLGFKAYFLLPVLTVGILLGWHHVLRQPWRVSRNVLYLMAVECLGLAVGLWLSWRLYGFLLQTVVHSVGLNIADSLGKISSYLGAGIYEELLFRLILLNLAIGLLAWMRAGPWASVIGGVVLTSLLFSAAHYVPGSGDRFLWLTFLFRFLAGVFFAVLFRYRGFGIAVGTHAFYDVLVGLSSIVAR